MIIEVRRSKIQVLRVVDKHIGDRLEVKPRADTSRDVLPREGTSQLFVCKFFFQSQHQDLEQAEDPVRLCRRKLNAK
ncbi:hypothetical protein TNCV_805441 [Trichonephila clavipes]|nr:hypothetical protein TNCV_805441 [Trichonephila clavipes]